MNGEELVREIMKVQFGVEIDITRLSGEVVELYLEELDGNIISEKAMKLLPDPVVFETYSYEEKEEWLIGVALEEATNQPLFLFCLKNGVKVFERWMKGGEE